MKHWLTKTDDVIYDEGEILLLLLLLLRMKNSALHEAAALGSEGLRCAKVLLRYVTPVQTLTQAEVHSCLVKTTYLQKELLNRLFLLSGLQTIFTVLDSSWLTRQVFKNMQLLLLLLSTDMTVTSSCPLVVSAVKPVWGWGTPAVWQRTTWRWTLAATTWCLFWQLKLDWTYWENWENPNRALTFSLLFKKIWFLD